ncbi:MAG: iron chelate uptake ABC transporter family permease subunit [candidate division WOR-3 bacterium]
MLILIYFLKGDILLINLLIHKLIIIFIVGVSLSLSGLILQNILKNPLVEPYILGISSASALGFVISIILNFNIFLTNALMLSFIFMCYVLIISNYGNSLKFILIGISINLICSSLINLLMAISKQDIFKTIFILWGNLDRILTKNEVLFLYICLIIVVFSLIWIYFNRKKLLLLSLSDEESLSLGLELKKYKRVFITISFILVSISVYFAGIIGFVGLIVPHISKILNKDNYSFVIFDCVNISLILLILAQLLLKFLNFSLPIGIITSLIGAPFFVLLLIRYLR